MPPALVGALSTVVVAGWILLLVAFALGLPGGPGLEDVERSADDRPGEPASA